ncbi:MAG: Bro-N domain-containing protein [Nanoarchaeota archaeon]
MEKESALVVFQDKRIRRAWHEGEWFFSVVDVVDALEVSTIPKRYWSDLKAKISEEGFEPYDKIVQLRLIAEDGKSRETDCANTKNIFRIIQSIPSPKAEPFKLWLAKIGYERVQEIENPELAQARMKDLYKAKGYSDDWIERRVRGIAIRQELTDEWDERGVKKEKEYAMLTNEISKATFGKTVEEYKKHKDLNRENLRDHMTDLELIFNMLGEASTTEIARKKDAWGFSENRAAAMKGGKIAGDAREKLESETGAGIVSKENYLDEPEKEKRRQIARK